MKSAINALRKASSPGRKDNVFADCDTSQNFEEKKKAATKFYFTWSSILLNKNKKNTQHSISAFCETCCHNSMLPSLTRERKKTWRLLLFTTSNKGKITKNKQQQQKSCSVLGLRRMSYAYGWKSFKFKKINKRGKFIYAGFQQCRQIHI